LLGGADQEFVDGNVAGAGDDIGDGYDTTQDVYDPNGNRIQSPYKGNHVVLRRTRGRGCLLTGNAEW
jgi:hypothetical protein